MRPCYCIVDPEALRGYSIEESPPGSEILCTDFASWFYSGDLDIPLWVAILHFLLSSLRSLSLLSSFCYLVSDCQTALATDSRHAQLSSLWSRHSEFLFPLNGFSYTSWNGRSGTRSALSAYWDVVADGFSFATPSPMYVCCRFCYTSSWNTVLPSQPKVFTKELNWPENTALLTAGKKYPCCPLCFILGNISLRPHSADLITI